ncbi:putative phage abortive infection protein [Arsenicibacter rosenii]|nr:putative phage abortive infection protein [Arsenicibacter rosenii]
MKQEEKIFAVDRIVTLGIILSVGTMIFVLGLIFSRIYNLNTIFDSAKEIEGLGQIGDVIGGVSSPIIGLIGALLTFLAFWIQYSFNQYQTIKIEEQGRDSERSRFEGLFFEMLHIHRENVSDITIKNTSKGRRAFISMFKEFKFCYYVLINIYNEYKKEHAEFELTDIQLVNIGFVTFYWGLGESSEEIVNTLLFSYPEEFRKKYYEKLEYYQQRWIGQDLEIERYAKSKALQREAEFFGDGKPSHKIEVQIKAGKAYSLTAGYKPFAGHLARLGHYYRHLFQTVDFIERQNPQNKNEYIRMLRAQISSHEQLLLYYNSLTVMGTPWWDREFIKQYKLVKNIPLPLANISPLPTDKLSFNYFEWDEITLALQKQQREVMTDRISDI